MLQKPNAAKVKGNTMHETNSKEKLQSQKHYRTKNIQNHENMPKDNAANMLTPKTNAREKCIL